MRKNLTFDLSNACKNIYPKLIYSICSINLKYYYTQFLNNSPFINYPFSYCMLKFLLLFNDFAKKIRTFSVFSNPLQTITCSNSKIKILEKMWNMFKVNKKKTPKRRHWRRPGVFFVNFEQILHHFLVFPLVNLNK